MHSTQGASGEGIAQAPAAATYTAIILAAANALSIVDRQILNLLVEPIKHDLAISDVQFSVLQGGAFVILYLLMTFPAGLMVDRRSRTWLLQVGILLWTMATAACGLAANYAHLFLARLGIGMGEATLVPAAHSMMADLFEPKRLARGFAIFQVGAYLGSGLAYALGGALIIAASALVSWPINPGLKAWQMVFIMAALPGFALALLILLTVREPARRERLPPQQARWNGIFDFIRHNGVLIAAHTASAALLGLLGYAIISWAPAIFIRRFGYSPAEVGLLYGAILGILGPLGTIAGSRLAEAWERRRKADGAIAVLQIGALGCGIAGAVLPFVTNIAEAACVLAIGTFCLSFPAAIGPAVLQRIAPSTYRGRLSAIYVVTLLIVSVAGGPFSVAAVTDWLLGDPARVHQAVGIVCGIAGPASAACAIVSRRRFRRWLDAAAKK